MSTIKTETLSTPSNATVPVDTVVNGTAKAWVNFNGTGTVAIRRAFNVSSITDNGTGNYTVNFTNAMVDADFSITGSGAASATGSPANSLLQARTDGNSACVIQMTGTSLASADREVVCVSIFS